MRLTDEPNSASLYFNQNGYTVDGRKLIYTTPDGISALNLETHATNRIVTGKVRVIVTGRKTQSVYYLKDDTIFAANADTGATREIAKVPPRSSVVTVNADETLLAGTYTEREAPTVNVTAPGQPQQLIQAPNKGQMMEERLAAHIPMGMFTVNTRTGEVKTILKSTDWLNHLEFSPTDPTLLMYCHEGPWHKVDRIWTIRADGSHITQIHTRTMAMEIFGHEFWAPDGKTIWYDLQTPRGEDFWLAGYNVETKARTWYHLQRDEWSIHFNVTKDGKLFCGDGGDPGQVAHAKDGEWIYLFRPELIENRGIADPKFVNPGVFHAEKLVNMSRHQYKLEPNVSFTPDEKWIVFRSNMFGPTYVFAVEVAKAGVAAMKFDFGEGLAKAAQSTPYTEERGSGFEGSGQPYYFSARVSSEGNYKVTVTLGDDHAASDTTIKAELRRLMAESVRVSAGKTETRTFIVNTRTTKIDTGGEVRLKDREKTTEAWAWDNKLTLEFAGPHPAVRSVKIEKADNSLPTLYIAGDSTSTDQPREPYNSWGQMITRFFGPEIAVANHGESGESLRSFIGEQRFAKLMSVMKPGDFLMIQMGHNDQKEKGEGVGAFTTYAADLKMFIDAARKRGVKTILVTPVSRLSWGTGADGNKIVNNLGDYPEAVRRVGVEENVPVIDLNAMSHEFYEALGPVNAPKAFADGDTTHHDNYGSYELAKAIVTGIRQQNILLEPYLVNTPAFDPAHPDPLVSFDIPAEPRVQAARPAGQ